MTWVPVLSVDAEGLQGRMRERDVEVSNIHRNVKEIKKVNNV